MLKILHDPDLDEIGKPAVPPRGPYHVRRFGRPFNLTVAKARHHSMQCRAHFAAQYLTGTLTVRPTLDTAAYIFQVCSPQITAALAELEPLDPSWSAVSASWACATPAEKAALVQHNLSEIWDLVDEATTA
jgi:hypothetical protein